MTHEESIEWVKSRMQFGRYTWSISNPFIKDDCYKAGQIAIESIEKQIPKKPIHGQNCMVCDSFNFRHRNYCFNCGQAIDWSDEE